MRLPSMRFVRLVLAALLIPATGAPSFSAGPLAGGTLDPTTIPKFVTWHCHIISHEDQQMMRPYCVGDPAPCNP